MKSILLVITMCACSMASVAQISFEEGYFIDNSGQRTDCLIKNIDWRYNPSDFQYKLSETSELKEAKLANIQEFASGQTFKFVRAMVDIDRSSDMVHRISNKRAPDFVNEQVFLQVIVEGKASLFVLKDANFFRFFSQVETEPIVQLIHKFYNEKGSYINENNTYRQQLLEQLKCSVVTFQSLQKVDYNEKELKELFIDYNTCVNHGYSIFKDDKKWISGFNIHLRPGVHFNSFSLGNSSFSYRDNEFDSAMGLRFGVEAEVVMNFNKNKWAAFIEPSYISYKTDGTTVPRTQSVNAPISKLKVEQTAVEVPIGIRHYLFLNENSKLFLDLAYVNNFPLKSELTVEGNSNVNEFATRDHLAIGAGYKLNNRYGLACRYTIGKRDYNANIAAYNYLGLIFNYTIFSGNN